MIKNIQKRSEFEQALQKIAEARDVVADVESNGLHPFAGNRIIGISVYLPEYDLGFNFPFRHGDGVVEVPYTATNTPDKDFHDMTWAGRTKGYLYASYWYNRWQRETDPRYGSLPVEWMAEMHDVWALPHQTYYFHNAPFDLNFLLMDGFPRPQRVHDTMVSLHLVHEDWSGISMTAPYVYTYSDVRRNLCKREDVGMWARDPQGNLLEKEQQGNRKLKWQTARLGVEGATEGEGELRKARVAFEDLLTDFIMDNLDDPMNEGLVYSNTPSPTRLTGDKVADRHPRLSTGLLRGLEREMRRRVHPVPMFSVDKDYKNYARGTYEVDRDGRCSLVSEELTEPVEVFYNMVAYGKQWDKLRAKVGISEKAHMWMLPSFDVWYYAVLDVKLTWALYEWCMPIIESWDNLDLHETHQAVNYEVAWEMGVEGFALDAELALEKAREHDARITEIEGILEQVAQKYGVYAELSAIGSDDGFNPHSHQQLLRFLQSGILSEPLTDIFPDWYPSTQRVGLKTYPDAVVESTARGNLEDYEDHPVVKLVFELKRLQKSSNVYLKNWVNGQDADGRVHFNMDSTGTVSGRFSSWGKPAGNAQNIPDRNGYRVKESVVVPNDDWMFLAIDYGQLEARLASWIAEVLLGFGNREMTDLFLEGADMHSYVAEALDVKSLLYPNMSWAEIATYNGENYKKMVKKMGAVRADAVLYKSYVRQIAKTCNFGLLYNGTEYMISKQLKIDLQLAKVLVDRWRGLFPAFSEAQDYYTNLALTPRLRPSGDAGYVLYASQPISNRHRKLGKYDEWAWYYEDGIRKGFNPRESSAKKVWNNMVQGLGGYICTVSALHINRKYGDRVRWFANIHDALDGYIHRDHLEIVPDICNIMMDWEIIPNLTVDAEASLTNWQDMKEIEDLDEWISSRGINGYGE